MMLCDDTSPRFGWQYALRLCLLLLTLSGFLFTPGFAYAQCACAPETACPYTPEETTTMRQTLKNMGRERGFPERFMSLFDSIDGCELCFNDATNVQISWTIDKEKYRAKYGKVSEDSSSSMSWRADLELRLRKLQEEGVVTSITIRSLQNKCRCCRPGETRQPEAPPGDGPGLGVPMGEAIPPDLYAPAKPTWEDPADGSEAVSGKKIKRAVAETFDDPAERDVHPLCTECQGVANEHNVMATGYNDLIRSLNEYAKDVFRLEREVNHFFHIRNMSDVDNKKEMEGDDPAVSASARALRKAYDELVSEYERKKKRFAEMKEERRVTKEKLEAYIGKIAQCESSDACKPKKAEKTPIQMKFDCPSGEKLMAMATVYKACGACQKLAEQANEDGFQHLCAEQKYMDANKETYRIIAEASQQGIGGSKLSEMLKRSKETKVPLDKQRKALKETYSKTMVDLYACANSCKEPLEMYVRQTGERINP